MLLLSGGDGTIIAQSEGIDKAFLENCRIMKERKRFFDIFAHIIAQGWNTPAVQSLFGLHC